MLKDLMYDSGDQHTYLLERIDEAYESFENKRDGVIKVALEC